jgi:hypothetical protein
MVFPAEGTEILHGLMISSTGRADMLNFAAMAVSQGNQTVASFSTPRV